MVKLHAQIWIPLVPFDPIDSDTVHTPQAIKISMVMSDGLIKIFAFLKTSGSKICRTNVIKKPRLLNRRNMVL